MPIRDRTAYNAYMKRYMKKKREINKKRALGAYVNPKHVSSKAVNPIGLSPEIVNPKTTTVQARPSFLKQVSAKVEPPVYHLVPREPPVSRLRQIKTETVMGQKNAKNGGWHLVKIGVQDSDSPL